MSAPKYTCTCSRQYDKRCTTIVHGVMLELTMRWPSRNKAKKATLYYNVFRGDGWTVSAWPSRYISLLILLFAILTVVLIINCNSLTGYQLFALRPSQIKTIKLELSPLLSPMATSASTLSLALCNTMLDNLLQYPGSSELEQLKVTLNIPNPANTFENVTMNYRKHLNRRSFDIISADIHDNCLAILISERLVQGYTKVAGVPAGGADFHTVALGQTTVTYCPYMDLHNGSYAVLCPLYEQCVNVTSHLLHIDYVAYAPRVRNNPVNRVLVSNKQFCYLSANDTSTNTKSSWTPRSRPLGLYWHRRQSENSRMYPRRPKVRGSISINPNRVPSCVLQPDYDIANV